MSTGGKLKQAWIWALFLRTLGEIVWNSLRSLLCQKNAEQPEVHCQATDVNSTFLKRAADALSCFSPATWMSGPWTQTAFLSLLAKNQKYSYTKQEFMFKDGVPCLVEFKALPYIPKDAPLVVICHGIAGDGNNGFIASLSDAATELGWRAAVFVRRGYGGMSLLPARGSRPHTIFPCYSMTTDLDDITQQLQSEFPDAPKVLVGVSAGSNIVVQYLAQYNEHPYLCGLSLSNAYDIDAMTEHLDNNTWLACSSLVHVQQQYIAQHEEAISQLAIEAGIPLNWTAIKRTRRTRELDRELRVPLHRYKTAEELYLKNSCSRQLHQVRVPLLCMSNRDDPLIAEHLIQHGIKASLVNPNVVAVVTKHGGHTGWLETCRNTWSTKVVVPFIEAVLEHRRT